MFARLKRLYRLLSSEQRKTLLRLQMLVVLMAFAETFGVASVGAFMALVSDLGRLSGSGRLASWYIDSGVDSPELFVFYIGFAVFAILFITTAVSIYTVWRVSMYASHVGEALTVRLYRHYMRQPWLFHSGSNSSQLTSKIASETGRVTNQIIQPLMQMNAKMVMSVVMITGIFVLNPYIAVAGLVIFGSAYLLLYRTVRRKLVQNGSEITQANRRRFQLMSEGFGGIKDVLVLGRQSSFDQRFAKASRQYAVAQGSTRGLSQAPRYIMELLAYGSIVLLTLYLLIAHSADLSTVLPFLAVYALAGFKLLPAFQQIYTGVAAVRSNLAAFDSLESDLQASQDAPLSEAVCDQSRFYPEREIRLHNIRFSYPGKERPALDGLDIAIPVNRVVGFVGASGSGKSTAVDVLLGLIAPQSGELRIDGLLVTPNNKRAWQNTVGFVPQAIFLADATIRENIAFGMPAEEIDEARIAAAVQMAHLAELIGNLPDGLNTRVGERGVQLSGGQRQRIGIARALYDDAKVLVLDEATSALDGITEQLVMDAIHDFSGEKTIIIVAHRLATVQRCDRIFLIDKGSVRDSGSYDELLVNSNAFRRMANENE